MPVYALRDLVGEGEPSGVGTLNFRTLCTGECKDIMLQ